MEADGYGSTRPYSSPSRLAPARCKTKDAYQEPAEALNNSFAETVNSQSAWRRSCGTQKPVQRLQRVLTVRRMPTGSPKTENLSRTPGLRPLELEKRAENRYSPGLTAQDRRPSLHRQRNPVPSEPID